MVVLCVWWCGWGGSIYLRCAQRSFLLIYAARSTAVNSWWGARGRETMSVYHGTIGYDNRRHSRQSTSPWEPPSSPTSPRQYAMRQTRSHIRRLHSLPFIAHRLNYFPSLHRHLDLSIRTMTLKPHRSYSSGELYRHRYAKDSYVRVNKHGGEWTRWRQLVCATME